MTLIYAIVQSRQSQTIHFCLRVHLIVLLYQNRVLIIGQRSVKKKRIKNEKNEASGTGPGEKQRKSPSNKSIPNHDALAPWFFYARKENTMISKFDIGDTVLLTGTVDKIEQYENGVICYILREYNVPVMETSILARVEKPWKVEERRKEKSG